MNIVPLFFLMLFMVVFWRLLPLLRHSCCITDPKRRVKKEGLRGECLKAKDKIKTTVSIALQ